MELSIIIPAYNEALRLPSTLEKVFMHLRKSYQGNFEVVVADDGSGDETAAVVRNYMEHFPELRIMAFSQNRGRGAVVRDAVLASCADYILEMDADGSVDPEAIPRFLEYLKDHPEADFLVGSRNAAKSRILAPQPALRIFLGNGFLFLCSIFFGWRMKDLVNGFKMFRLDAAHDIFRYQYIDHFFAEAEIVQVGKYRGWKIKDLPVLWSDNRDSKVRPFREIRRSFKGIFKILWWKWSGKYTKNLSKR
ncbi:MAG: glycosyltransferase [Candidatus Sungbacteria bacterium]|nr:glycosyltransferase [Candidatus Sungbacteria bacterium]